MSYIHVYHPDGSLMYVDAWFRQREGQDAMANMRALYLGRGLKAALLYYVLFETDNHDCLHPRPRNADNYKLKIKGKIIELELYVTYTNKGKPVLADKGTRRRLDGSGCRCQVFIGHPKKEKDDQD